MSNYREPSNFREWRIADAYFIRGYLFGAVWTLMLALGAYLAAIHFRRM